MKEISFSDKPFQCPVTGREETVSLKTTTFEKKGTMRETFGKVIASKSTHKVQGCTGLNTCEVRTVHGRSSTCDWSKCPLISILNTSRNEP